MFDNHYLSLVFKRAKIINDLSFCVIPRIHFQFTIIPKPIEKIVNIFYNSTNTFRGRLVRGNPQ